MGKSTPTVTATGPATGTAGTAIAAGHQLGPRCLLGLERLRHHHLQGLRPRPTPRPPAPPGAPRSGTATVTGNATYNPSAGYTPTRPATTGGTPLRRRRQQQRRRRDLWPGMSETVVGQATPTVTANVPATGTAGTAIAASNISSTLAASSGSNATGTITFTGLRPPDHRPDHLHQRRHRGGHGHGPGNATYHPRPATHRRGR